MPKKRPKPHPDVAETAYRTMLEATGQAPKTLPRKRRRKGKSTKGKRGAG